MKMTIRILTTALIYSLFLQIVFSANGLNVSAAPLEDIEIEAPFVISSVDELPLIVSMGDSYSSGEGNEPFYDQKRTNDYKVTSQDWLAHRSECSWSGQISFDIIDGPKGQYKDIKGYRWYLVASSGATTAHMLFPQGKTVHGWNNYVQKGYIDPQLLVFSDNDLYGKVDYVTLTLGGNDVGFEDIIKTSVACSFLILDICKLDERLDQAWTTFETQTSKDLADTYAAIHAEAGEQATILVVGYPPLINDEKCTKFFGWVEADKINKKIIDFNDGIANVVMNYKEADPDNPKNIDFISIYDEFKTHEAYTDKPYINEIMFAQSEDINKLEITDVITYNINPASLLSSYSIHPNFQGQQEIAKKVQKHISDNYLKQSNANPEEISSSTPTEVRILSEEEAKTAFRNYMIKEILPENFFGYNYEYLRWSEFEVGDDYCRFSWEHRDAQVVEYTMNFISGDTTSVEYSVSDHDVISEGEFDFNAWDYIEDSPVFSNTDAIELKSILGMDNNEACALIASYGDICEEDVPYGYCYKSDCLSLQIFDSFLGEPLDCVGCVILKQSEAFSIYGISPGMNWREALNRLTISGAQYAYSQDYHYMCFEMDDGNWVGINYSESKTVNEVRLAKSTGWFHIVDDWLMFTPKLYYRSITDDEALSAITNYIDIPESTLEELQEKGIPCYWGITTSDEYEIVIFYRAYTGWICEFHIDRNTGFTRIFEYYSRTGDYILTDESFNAWDYYEE